MAKKVLPCGDLKNVLPTAAIRMRDGHVALEKERLSYTPSTPACLRGPVKIEYMGESQCASPKDTVIIQQNFPKT